MLLSSLQGGSQMTRLPTLTRENDVTQNLVVAFLGGMAGGALAAVIMARLNVPVGGSSPVAMTPAMMPR